MGHRRGAGALGADASVLVVTSVHTSDDPLAAYLGALGVPCFRGRSMTCSGRFVAAVDAFPCEWVLRLSADSPLLSSIVIREVAFSPVREDADLVTTIDPRTLPKGQNAELVRVASLRALNRRALTVEQREHVTKALYDEASQHRIVNVAPPLPELAGQPDMAVDHVADLQRLEELADRLATRRSKLESVGP
jgi:spore coat polysaccharide biosynthesis protein SpsF (cytidylyltransferase family)